MGPRRPPLQPPHHPAAAPQGSPGAGPPLLQRRGAPPLPRQAHPLAAAAPPRSARRRGHVAHCWPAPLADRPWQLPLHLTMAAHAGRRLGMSLSWCWADIEHPARWQQDGQTAAAVALLWLPPRLFGNGGTPSDFPIGGHATAAWPCGPSAQVIGERGSWLLCIRREVDLTQAIKRCWHCRAWLPRACSHKSGVSCFVSCFSKVRERTGDDPTSRKAVQRILLPCPPVVLRNAGRFFRRVALHRSLFPLAMSAIATTGRLVLTSSRSLAGRVGKAAARLQPLATEPSGFTGNIAPIR